MLTRCKHCLTEIRDCTAFSVRRQYVIGWYHTAHGDESCRGMPTIAEPQPLVDVSCRFHPSTCDDACRSCDTAMQVSGYFHNDGRCIPKLCGWLHVQRGLDAW